MEYRYCTLHASSESLMSKQIVIPQRNTQGRVELIIYQGRQKVSVNKRECCKSVSLKNSYGR